MLCISPLRLQSGNTVKCGQCMNCRINHKLRWMGRLALEARNSKGYIFVTLTYADEHLPENNTLDPGDLRFFLKKWRRKAGPGARFFAVGEYGHDGERDFNPHYHVLLFDTRDAAKHQEAIDECWTRDGKHLGFSDAEDPRDPKSALGYVVGYVTKKLTAFDNPDLGGRYPEFFRCSRYPRLGDSGIRELARYMSSRQAAMSLVERGFPTGFMIEGQWFPFFRIDRDQLMKLAGYEHWPSDQFDSELSQIWDIDLLNLYHRAEQYNWSQAQLMDKIYKLRVEHDEIALARKQKQAEARAAKARRRAAAERAHHPRDLSTRNRQAS